MNAAADHMSPLGCPPAAYSHRADSCAFRSAGEDIGAALGGRAQAIGRFEMHSAIDHCSALFGVVRFCRDSLMAQYGEPKGLGR